MDKNYANPNHKYMPPLPKAVADMFKEESEKKITITVAEYFGLVRDARDLQILRRAYMTSTYGVGADVLKAIFGPKPEPPKPDPADAAVTAAVAAANAAKDAAERVQALVDKAEKANGSC